MSPSMHNQFNGCNGPWDASSWCWKQTERKKYAVQCMSCPLNCLLWDKRVSSGDTVRFSCQCNQDSVVSATKQAVTFWVSLASIVQFSITNGSSRCSVMWHCNIWLSSCKLLQPYRYTRPNLEQDKGFFGATILLLRSVGYRTPLWSLEKDSEVSFAMYQ
jgi:hypothetical protein